MFGDAQLGGMDRSIWSPASRNVGNQQQAPEDIVCIVLTPEKEYIRRT